MAKKRRKETKKERKQRLANEPQMPAHLTDSAYVETMLQGRLNPAVELLSDSRVGIWFERLRRTMSNITDRGHISPKDADLVLKTILEWEEQHPQGFSNKHVAAAEIAKMIDRLSAHIKARFAARGRKMGRDDAQDLGDLVEAVMAAKINYLKSVQRLMLPEGQAAVDTYLQCVKALTEATEGVVRSLKDESLSAGVQLARQIWAWMRNARVFEISNSIWTGLDLGHQRQLIDLCARNQVPEPEMLSYIRDLAYHQPFPEKLPFECFYVGLGAGVMLAPELSPLRIRHEDRDRLVGVELLGYLVVGPARQVYEMLYVILDDDDYILPVAQCQDGFWPTGETLAAWITWDLVNLINEHNTVVINHEPSLRMKENFKKASNKAPGFLPKPYYTIRMQHKIVDESQLDQKGSGLGRVLSRRYDRRGHERCYIERGPLSIDPKMEAKLLKYGYRFIVGKPNADDAERLAYRNFPPKRSDEWMAIKVRWIEDTVVGDENLPYIPAVRIPARAIRTEERVSESTLDPS